jgi:glutathione S-transferase
MKLYYAPGACSLSPHIVAAEADIPLSLEQVDLRAHKTQSGADYYTINPKGYVPALQLDDGEILTEGPAIVQYLADRKPDSGLLPKEGTGRYRVLEWLTFINGEIHKSFSPLFRKAPEDQQAAAKDNIQKRFAYAAIALGSKDYLTGPHFTLADAYLFVMLRWAEKMDIPAPANLHHLFERIKARPKVAQVLKAEGLD